MWSRGHMVWRFGRKCLLFALEAVGCGVGVLEKIRRVTMVGNAYRHGVNVGGLNSGTSPVPKALQKSHRSYQVSFHYNT